MMAPRKDKKHDLYTLIFCTVHTVHDLIAGKLDVQSL